MSMLPGLVTAHCFWIRCKHVEVGDSSAVHDAMEAHYRTSHVADLAALGYPTPQKENHHA